MPSGSKKGAAANGHAAAPFFSFCTIGGRWQARFDGQKHPHPAGPLPIRRVCPAVFPCLPHFCSGKAARRLPAMNFRLIWGRVLRHRRAASAFPRRRRTAASGPRRCPPSRKRQKAPERHAVRRVFLYQPRVSSLLHILPPVCRRYTLSVYIPPLYPLLPHTHSPLRPPVSPIYFLPHGRLHRTFLRACRLCPLPLPAIPSPPRSSPVGYSLSAAPFFCRIFSVRHPILLPDTFCPPPRCPRLHPAAHSPF